jgi:hypothetical protein
MDVKVLNTSDTQTNLKVDLSDKKATKKIIKRSKKHPEWYSQEEVAYAKMIRKQLKKNERQSESRPE